MPAAFSTFDEPHAHLLRGFVEYGWPDLTLTGGQVPPGVFGGFDLGTFVQSGGRAGLRLDVPALADGHLLPDDGTYVFVAKLTRNAQGATVVLVRCPEANFLQEFPVDPANPAWAAGWVHQALLDYVPAFVRWRRQGGEVPWSTRAGMPDADGAPASPALLRFLGDLHHKRRRLDSGPAEGWWLAGAPPARGPIGAVASAPAGGAPLASAGLPVPGPAATPIAMVGKGAGDPTILSRAARDELARRSARAGGVGFDGLDALNELSSPGYALLVLAGLGGVQAVLWFVNGISVALKYKDQPQALVFSVLLAVLVAAGSAGAGFGAWRYRQGRGGPLPIFAMLFAALLPGCCVAGIPVAVWAFRVWRRPGPTALRALR